MTDMNPTDADAAVLRTFLTPDGALISIPAKHRKRLVTLAHLAQRFEPGRRYSEIEVNALLRPAHADVAALRRHLVEDGFLDRADGEYWLRQRSSGSILNAPHGHLDTQIPQGLQ